jgi:hypothetical protein
MLNDMHHKLPRPGPGREKPATAHFFFVVVLLCNPLPDTRPELVVASELRTRSGAAALFLYFDRYARDIADGAHGDLYFDLPALEAFRARAHGENVDFMDT